MGGVMVFVSGWVVLAIFISEISWDFYGKVYRFELLLVYLGLLVFVVYRLCFFLGRRKGCVGFNRVGVLDVRVLFLLLI